MMKLLKEPLVHFLIGALLIFGFFWATGSNRDPADYDIAIGKTDIERLETAWIQNFRRLPTDAELASLIDQEIKEEIYYREALRLGLDRDDPVVRRRLFTKMRFLDNREISNAEPSDTVLQKWLDNHAEKYSQSARYSFEQIYLGQDPDFGKQSATTILEKLKKSPESGEKWRQPLSLARAVRKAENAAIERQFGEIFSAQLNAVPMDQWHGPIQSGFGLHFVKISEKLPGAAPALEDVRQTVLNDWRAAQKAAQEEDAFQAYRKDYSVTIAGRE
ncbi:MAG: peptidylprolyl isomerase [Parasphingorhabdus sp.]|uniref:peptidylprolyl isomerase n=1 Tax=Parasphingorhabdus sp. TaxID=2709688 RepID=UPI0032998199